MTSAVEMRIQAVSPELMFSIARQVRQRTCRAQCPDGTPRLRFGCGGVLLG
jgi:hypothetical protein